MKWENVYIPQGKGDYIEFAKIIHNANKRANKELGRRKYGVAGAEGRAAYWALYLDELAGEDWLDVIRREIRKYLGGHDEETR